MFFIVLYLYFFTFIIFLAICYKKYGAINGDTHYLQKYGKILLVVIRMIYDRKNENYVYEYIGKNIRKYRKEKGLTQLQLADRAHYSKQMISNMENNTHQTFSLGTLWSIAQALDIEMYKLCIEPTNDKVKQKEKDYFYM